MGSTRVCTFVPRSLQVLLEGLDVGQQEGHDLGPSPVESLVPNGRLEAGDLEPAVDLGSDVLLALPESLVPYILREKIHLVDEAEDSRIWR